MIAQLTKIEVNECLDDLKIIGIHGLKGVEIKQCVQLWDEVRNRKQNEVRTAIDIMRSAIEYQYPDEYKNGREFDYWLERSENYFILDRIEKILTDHLNPDSKINEQPEPNIPEKRGIGRPKATAKYLEDYLIDHSKYYSIIARIITAYEKDKNRDLYFMVYVLSEMKIFDEKKSIGNITNLSIVLQNDFNKGSYKHLKTIEGSINIHTDPKSICEFKEHKNRLTKIIEEQ